MSRSPKTTLRQKYPDIDTYWHPTKNGDLTPDTVGVRSEKIAWFQCPNDPSHEHQARVKNKTLVADRSNGRWGCPLCSGYYLGSPRDSLASKRPDLAKDWHPTKNGNLTPQNITPSSNQKVWWQCERDHEYELEPNQRVNANRGCPDCSRYGYGSSQELRIYCELKSIFPDTSFRQKIQGKEIDVVVPSLKLGIEYDSAFYHQDKEREDRAKNALMEHLGLRLIRVREQPLHRISSLDVITPMRQLSKKDLNRLVESVAEACAMDKNLLANYLSEKDFINNENFASYISYSDRPIPENSLAETFPKIASQWDYEKNDPLTPYDFSHGSKFRAWWVCTNGHSFDATINSRTYHADGPYEGCRYCAWDRKLPNDGSQNELLE